MERYCITLQQAKRLRELSFLKSYDHTWYEVESADKRTLVFFDHIPSMFDSRPMRLYPAYHVGELGEILPSAFTDLVYRGNGTWFIKTWDQSTALLNIEDDGHPTEAEARGLY